MRWIGLFVLLAMSVAFVAVSVWVRAPAEGLHFRQDAQAGVACSPRWRSVARGARVPTLVAVGATSPTDVWAAGHRATGQRSIPLAAHWDGRSLRVLTPFGHAKQGEVTGVAALAANDVWAVGNVWTVERVDRSPRVARWDGRSWKNVALPPLRYADLFDLVALSASDVWAVGSIGATSENMLPLVLHWNGHAWRRFKPPASGYVPGYELLSIDAASRNDIWAVGLSGINDSHTENWAGYGVHWSGRRWRELTALTGAETLRRLAVDVVSPHEVWALGESSVSTDDYVDRIDGHRPRTILVAAQGATVHDLAAAGRNDIWVVGEKFQQDRSLPLAVHWNGRHVISRTPFPSFAGSLYAVIALSPTDVWAAGDRLIARYSC